jgi:hypothetical protein
MKRYMGLGNMLRARALGSRDVKDAATHLDILERAATEPIAPLAVLSGMLERVSAGVPGHSTAQDELSAAHAVVLTHDPVVRYVMKDCLVHPGGVEFRGGFWPKIGSRRDRLPRGKIVEIENATYCMRPVSARFFGHWLTDACPTALLAAAGDNIFLDDRPDWPDAKHYARAFALPVRGPEVAHVGRLFLFSDYSQGELKKQRYKELKQRLRSHLDGEVSDGRPVYLRRGRSGEARLILNETELCERLSAAGFEILDVASISFAERMSRLAAAPLVVSVDGSHLNHAIFAMESGKAIVSLIPGDRFTMIHRGICHAVGLRFGCLVLPRHGEGYLADVEEVLRTVDLVT